MARNVYNQKEIQEWVDITSASVGRPEVAKWIKSTVRLHVINGLQCYEKVEDIEEGMPDWAVKGIEEGTLEYLNFDSWLWAAFLEELEHALIFVDTVRGDVNVNFHDAIRGGLDLIRLRNEKSSEMEDWSGLENQITSTEGYDWVSLSSRQNLARESKLMQHCVGHNPHYYEEIQNGRCKIYSLRDKNNNPHCTIQVSSKDNSVIQIRGKQNTVVVPKYHRACSEFLGWLKPSHVPEHDMRYLGLTRINNTVYNVLSLPDGLEVQDNLNLAGYGLLESLPGNLTVHGNLSISRTNIRELPPDLYVGGSFSASSTPLQSIPETVHFGGSVNISDTPVTSFPEKAINGMLNIRDSNITYLPKGCTYIILIQHFMQLHPKRTKQMDEALTEQVRQSNDLVDSVLKHVASSIDRKLAHELRIFIAKRSNKFEVLMEELRNRGISVT